MIKWQSDEKTRLLICFVQWRCALCWTFAIAQEMPLNIFHFLRFSMSIFQFDVDDATLWCYIWQKKNQLDKVSIWWKLWRMGLLICVVQRGCALCWTFAIAQEMPFNLSTYPESEQKYEMRRKHMFLRNGCPWGILLVFLNLPLNLFYLHFSNGIPLQISLFILHHYL